MSTPRRLADGPSFSFGPSASPRRGIARPTLSEMVVPSLAGLATTAAVGAVAIGTAASLTLPAYAAPAPTAKSDALAASVLANSTQGRRFVVAEAVELAAVQKVEQAKVASEKAAADKAAADKAASEKAAADKAAAAKAAAKASADKAAAAKVAVATTSKPATATAVTAAPTGNFPSASRYGLRGGAVKTYNAVMSNFSGINEVGGYRASSLSNHQLGLAIDFMITPGSEDALGYAIAQYLVANARALNVNHIIFKQRIWTPSNPTWRLMENRGSATANHMDHVHVSMNS